MVLDGRSIIDRHIVSFPDKLLDNETVVQPNGIDLRVDKVFHLEGRSKLPRDKKIDVSHLKITEMLLKDGYFDLYYTTGNYLVDFRETASLKDGFCGIIVPRSSLLRTGVFITSALWDTGFEGRLGASVRVRNPIQIEYGAAIAQIMIMQSEFNGHRYDGGYQYKTSQTQWK